MKPEKLSTRAQLKFFQSVREVRFQIYLIYGYLIYLIQRCVEKK